MGPAHVKGKDLNLLMRECGRNFLGWEQAHKKMFENVSHHFCKRELMKATKNLNGTTKAEIVRYSK